MPPPPYIASNTAPLEVHWVDYLIDSSSGCSTETWHAAMWVHESQFNTSAEARSSPAHSNSDYHQHGHVCLVLEHKLCNKSMIWALHFADTSLWMDDLHCQVDHAHIVTRLLDCRSLCPICVIDHTTLCHRTYNQMNNLHANNASMITAACEHSKCQLNKTFTVY